MELLVDLRARGLIHDATDEDELARRLAAGPVTLYCGFDPTADSLHIGSLVGMLVLRRFAEAGHRALALVGGATGMIGDPSGRSEERNLLDEATLGTNLAGIRDQLDRIAGASAVVDNATWTARVGLLEFLRDVGKHVTVNQMVAKESVRARMEGTDGISFTEFSYMLLQGNDYLELHQGEGCELQIGGSDQWGNITLGIDLIRRRTGARVHGLTWPLLLRSDGRKFGKSEAGNVWLSATRTSPYQFFQHWMQVPDADVRRFLLQLTLLPVATCEDVAGSHEASPERREGQRVLAREVTGLVHGDGAAAAAEGATEVLFGGDPTVASAAVLELLAGEVPGAAVARDDLVAGMEPADLLVATGAAPSRSEARRLVAQGAAYVNGRRAGEGVTVSDADLLHGRWLLVRKGKREYRLVDVG